MSKVVKDPTYNLVYVSEEVIKVFECDYKQELANFMNNEMKTEEEVILWKSGKDGYNKAKLEHHICKKEKKTWAVAGDAYGTTEFKIVFPENLSEKRKLKIITVRGAFRLASILNTNNLMRTDEFILMMGCPGQQLNPFDFLETVDSFEWQVVLDAL